MCKIVQANWKVSPSWEPVYSEEKNLEDLRDEIDNTIDPYVFGGEDISKIIKQTECDVFGISIGNLGVSTIYAVDIAFHRNGLGYGDSERNAIKIIQKCVRTAMCIYKYFEIPAVEIIFATPFIKQNQVAYTEKKFKEAATIVKTILGYNVKLIHGDDFKKEILNQVNLLADKVNDTSEYFLRCRQLEDMFSRQNNLIETRNDDHIENSKHEESIKVGIIANVELRKLLHDTADAQLIKKLQNLSFCKEIFKLRYPVITKERNEGNKARYYSKPLFLQEKTYYLCNDWYEHNRDSLAEWINNFKEK